MQEQSTLKIHKQTLPFLNISLYLNDIKPVQSLTIENTSETDSAQLEIKITTDLPCIEPFNYNFICSCKKRRKNSVRKFESKP
jgi:hypothetical protein